MNEYNVEHDCIEINETSNLSQVSSNESLTNSGVSSNSTRKQNKFLSTLDENANEVKQVKKKSFSKILKFTSLSSYTQVRENYEKVHLHKREKKSQGYSIRYFFLLLKSIFSFKLYTSFFAKKLKGAEFVFLVFDFLIDLIYSILYLCELQINVKNLEKIETKLVQFPELLQLYRNGHQYLFVNRFTWIFYALTFLSCCNLSSVILKLMFADRFWKKLFSSSVFIDLIVGAPFIALAVINGGRFIYVPYFLIMIKSVYRLTRILRYRGVFFNLSALKEKLAILIFTVWTFESNFQPPDSQFYPYRSLDLMDSFYFTVITISTVGYGDLAPVSIPGRITVCCLIIVSLGIIPGLVSEVVDTLAMDKKGGGAYSRGSTDFIVVIGKHDSPDRMKDILAVFFHKDTVLKNKVVFLMREEPSQKIIALLNNTQIKEKVKYFTGCSLNRDDLERLQVNHASAVFILSNRSAQYKKEDEQNTLRAWAIDTFSPETPLYVYTMLPETESYLEQSTTATICLNELKQAILGYTTLYPGTSTLFNNLLNQTSPYPRYEQVWQAQYGDGSGNEIYSSTVNDLFVGEIFTEISWYLYKEFQVILFAVKTVSYKFGASLTMLNPGISYRFKKGDVLIFIAQNESIIYKISELTALDFLKSFTKSDDGIEQSSATLARGLTKSQTFSVEAGSFIFPKVGQNDDLYINSPLVPGTETKGPLCHLLKNPTVDLKYSVLDSCNLENFILVLTFDYDIFKFLCTLRAAHLNEKRFKPIVVLSPELPTQTQFDSYRSFPQLFFIKGDPLSKKDLLNAGLIKCEKVVVINFSSSGHIDDLEEMEKFIDTEALMVNHLIYNLTVDPENSLKSKILITELQRRQHIKFLKPVEKTAKNFQKLRKKNFAKKFVNKTEKIKNSSSLEYYYSPVFANGAVVVGATLESILFQTFQNDSILDIFKLFCGLKYEKDLHLEKIFNCEASFLGSIKVPTGFENSTFRDAYHYLAKHGIIPIALYRQPDLDWDNILPFIYTNPVPSCLLKESDMIYVLKKSS
ncbi:hypothetical protein HDU92_003049 [Lobulomyces angularis]|nr:hypothetical protein HDU92_003049 [Lobulomyces angularis]